MKDISELPRTERSPCNKHKLILDILRHVQVTLIQNVSSFKGQISGSRSLDLTGVNEISTAESLNVLKQKYSLEYSLLSIVCLEHSFICLSFT